MAKILVVDDEEPLRLQFRRALDRDGHQVTLAASLAEAASLLESRRFDAAVVDLRLGDGTGLDLLRWLRREHPDCARVLASGYLDIRNTIDAVTTSEVARLLAKPCTPSDVRRAVNDALDSSRQQLQSPNTRSDRRRLEALLREAGLSLALQPVVRAGTGEIIAYEAFLRSGDETLGSPARLYQAALEHRMLRDLTRAVAAHASAWLEQIPEDLSLFLNLHPEELADMASLEDTLQPLSEHASRVVLDITGHHHERWGRVLRDRLLALQGQGYRVALDDVGGGHESLQLLAEAEATYVKADPSIVSGVATSPRKRRLIEMLARFVEASNATLIAEGVEDPADAAVLAEAGVSLLQGHLYGEPSHVLVPGD